MRTFYLVLSHFPGYSQAIHVAIHHVFEPDIFPPNPPMILMKSAWLAQLVERWTAVREVKGSSPRPDQHSGS